MNEPISIDRYTAEVVKSGSRMVPMVFAIAGKKKYPIAPAYHDMCDEEHLAIRLVELERPELYDIAEGVDVYIPLRTA